MKYAALFVRKDSAYKNRPEFDCYDADRDATGFSGSIPVVAHPPCRAWGVMAHMAFRDKQWNKTAEGELKREAEKSLALTAIEMVRKNGGVLEHPAGSKLFGSHLPDVDDVADEFGGFTILIDQYDFGHVARKPTKLYVCGIERDELPVMPEKNNAIPVRSIAGNVKGTKRCTQYQREYTPEPLMDFISDILESVS